jgi:hypothetical protein
MLYRDRKLSGVFVRFRAPSAYLETPPRRRWEFVSRRALVRELAAAPWKIVPADMPCCPGNSRAVLLGARGNLLRLAQQFWLSQSHFITAL